MVSFLGAVSGPNVQSQNFRIEGVNVQDRMDCQEMCRKSIFRSLDRWVVTQIGGQAGRVRDMHPGRHMAVVTGVSIAIETLCRNMSSLSR